MEMVNGSPVTNNYNNKSQPVPLNGFARLLIASQPALVEHESETTGSDRAQTRGCEAMSKRANPPQPTQQTYDLLAPDTSSPPVFSSEP